MVWHLCMMYGEIFIVMANDFQRSQNMSVGTFVARWLTCKEHVYLMMIFDIKNYVCWIEDNFLPIKG